ncbi:uncharacterized protein EDB93DRAFT_1237264 [Suillus bovinus]|uniref:uncharacterized protein n=1 Tax=Suillus bovinus TaxID=48563 RepID=UPI001B884437|nr:uncharacterized protein EDB93DRAFT_1237264 [Suillus bovinus]KAG2160029.1 hypothetical protein EDB93DRAFT_1237264 [Suillus bovinus]
MALICHHNIPLFFANIDSPSVQQKYTVALIEHLFTLLPQEATVITLYDVGCVLSWSLSQYDILPNSVTSRLQFLTMAMHAYGHKWACQLKYNPCMCTGLGLSDGEGTERLWSRFVKLIGIQRSSSMRADLGDWIKWWLKGGVIGQGAAAQEVLDNCGIEARDLQEQWMDQKKSQQSIRAHAPAQLKKELVVLTLQADLDALDKALQLTWTIVEKGSASEETLDALESLERSHDRLMSKVETLYFSLNVHDRFPELQGVDLDFVQTLLMARDLKINIWKRLHQQTHKAIAKRQPALMIAIHKFNSYCEYLESIFDPSWGITPSVGDVPRWIEDTDVRDSIQALHKQQQCHEEQHHIGLKADNLCRWFGGELAALELALCSPTSK